MKTTLVARAIVGIATMGLSAVVSAGPASASASICDQSTPNDTILFYNKNTGAAGTGQLTDGRWQQHELTNLPTGYTHAAASRDTLVLYNDATGAIETGSFTNGVYTRKESGHGATGWTAVEASGDSVLFYDAATGHAASGTLQDGVYRELRAYDNFSLGWSSVASSCNIIAFVRNDGQGDLPNYVMGHGTLTNGIYTDIGDLGRVLANDLIATADSFLLRDSSTSTDSYQLAWETGLGSLGYETDISVGGLLGAPVIGTSGHWDLIGSTSDSLFFYKSDGTAWTSTLGPNDYANVGPIADVSSGWTIIEGAI